MTWFTFYFPTGYALASCSAANVVAAWNFYLTTRQLKATTDTMPAHVKELVDEEKFAKTQVYTRAKLRYSLWHSAYEALEANLALGFRMFPALWYWTQRVSAFPLGSFGHYVAFGAASELISTALSLPWSYYNHFVLEEKYGFNRMTKWEFVKDTIKTLLLKICVLQPLVSTVISWTVHTFGPSFPLYLFGIGTVLVIGFTFIFPAVIQPLFNKFTTLPPDGTLQPRIEALAKKLAFPLSKVYVVDGSRRSAHSNAYFYGFFNNKRIVLYDTLVTQLNEQQVLAVLCHEFGHWHHGHTLAFLGIGLTQLATVCFLARTALFNSALFADFGFQPGDLSPVVGFTLFTQLFEPVSAVLSMLLSVLSRRFEFQADAFAIKEGFGPDLRSGLLKMQEENLINLTPDWLYAACEYSHPPLPTRIAALDEQLKKQS